jgi:hypothetical protein
MRVFLKMIKLVKQMTLYVSARFFSSSSYQPEPRRNINCNSTQVKYYANTPNTIIFYDDGENSGYFRECRMHEAKRKYLERLINEYCRFVFVNEHSSECEKILLDKLKNPLNFYRFFYMRPGTAPYSRITKYRHTLDPSCIGIKRPYPEWFKNQLLSLVQYAWGPLEEYRYNSFQNIGDYHIYNSNRTIATKMLADTFGMNMLVPDSEYIELCIDGEKKIGVSVGIANGEDPNKIAIKNVNPQFQRETILLNILDAICFQKDHRPGNYFVKTNSQDEVLALSAFDNDCPTTLFPTRKIDFSTYCGCSSIVKNNEYNRPFIDKDCYEKIISFNDSDLSLQLKKSLSKKEYRTLLLRIRKLKAAIENSLKSGRTKIIDDNSWSQDTINCELSGNYGNTYLKYFVDCFCDNHRCDME